MFVGAIVDEGGVKTFFALGVDARSDGFQVLNCRENGGLLRKGEEGSWFCILLVLVFFRNKSVHLRLMKTIASPSSANKPSTCTAESRSGSYSPP